MLVGNTALKKIEKDFFFFFFFFFNFVSELGLIPRGVTPRVSYRMKLAQKKPTVTWCRFKKAVTICSGVLYIHTLGLGMQGKDIRILVTFDASKKTSSKCWSVKHSVKEYL